MITTVAGTGKLGLVMHRAGNVYIAATATAVSAKSTATA